MPRGGVGLSSGETGRYGMMLDMHDDDLDRSVETDMQQTTEEKWMGRIGLCGLILFLCAGIWGYLHEELGVI